MFGRKTQKINELESMLEQGSFLNARLLDENKKLWKIVMALALQLDLDGKTFKIEGNTLYRLKHYDCAFKYDEHENGEDEIHFEFSLKK